MRPSTSANVHELMTIRDVLTAMNAVPEPLGAAFPAAPSAPYIAPMATEAARNSPAQMKAKDTSAIVRASALSQPNW